MALAAELSGELTALLEAFRAAEAADEQSLRKLHADHVGLIRTKQRDALRQADNAEKKAIGQLTNHIVKEAEGVFEARLQSLAEARRRADLARTADVTLPGRARRLG